MCGACVLVYVAFLFSLKHSCRREEGDALEGYAHARCSLNLPKGRAGRAMAKILLLGRPSPAAMI